MNQSITDKLQDASSDLNKVWTLAVDQEENMFAYEDIKRVLPSEYELAGWRQAMTLDYISHALETLDKAIEEIFDEMRAEKQSKTA